MLRTTHPSRLRRATFPDKGRLLLPLVVHLIDIPSLSLLSIKKVSPISFPVTNGSTNRNLNIFVISKIHFTAYVRNKLSQAKNFFLNDQVKNKGRRGAPTFIFKVRSFP